MHSSSAFEAEKQAGPCISAPSMVPYHIQPLLMTAKESMIASLSLTKKGLCQCTTAGAISGPSVAHGAC